MSGERVGYHVWFTSKHLLLKMVDSDIGCLVIGSLRSGTTLCASMIGAHSDIGMHMEDRRHSTQPLYVTKMRRVSHVNGTGAQQYRS
jgi:hypothetical protein